MSTMWSTYRLFIVSITYLTCVFPAHAHTEDVYELTQLTFDRFLKSTTGKPMLLQFYAPWCSHCSRFAPVYSLVRQTLEDEVNVTRVDGDENRILRLRFRVKGFPTFFLIKEQQVWEYEGPRTHDGMVQFARSGGSQYGKQLDLFGGPLSLYWSAVTALLILVDRMRGDAARFQDRPLVLVAIIFGSVMASLFFVAIFIHIVTKPRDLGRSQHVHSD